MEKSYLKEVTPLSSIHELLELAKKEAGEHTAYIHKENKVEKRVNYNEFYEDVFALGTALADLGVSKTHVGCFAENSYKWINVYLSVLRSDSVFVGIDKELPAKDFLYVVNDSDTEVLFYGKKAEDMIKEKLDSLSNI